MDARNAELRKWNEACEAVGPGRQPLGVQRRDLR